MPTDRWMVKEDAVNIWRYGVCMCMCIHIHTHTHTQWNVQFSRSVVSDSLRPHELQHARPPCPSPTPGVHSNSSPSSQWCHPAISSSVIPFSSCPQSLPASGSFPMNQLFTWGGQSTGVSAFASFLPKKSQGWSPSEWTGWISSYSGFIPIFLKLSPNLNCKCIRCGRLIFDWNLFTSPLLRK